MKIIKLIELSLSIKRNYEDLPFDRERFKLVEEIDDPDYVFVVISHFMRSVELQRKFSDLMDRERVLIFYADEAISPDLNIFDYAITYDDCLKCGDRIARHPTCCFFKKYYGRERKMANLHDEYRHKKFCNFIYSNPYANENRDLIFWGLSEYQHVDSLGSHLNNVKCKNTRNEKNYFDISVELKSDYRFSIAAENSCFSGYTSEKILSSFYANTIPIYWGNPNIEDEFNPQAFVNLGGKVEKEILCEKISKINESEKLWIEYILQPIFLPKQIERQEMEKEKYSEFVNHIFEQKLADAKRAPVGTAVKEYSEFWEKRIGRK